jgi:putative peptide zinc metalloprotease protein
MAEPPKLELLTRTSEAAGFHIEELPSSPAHRQFRPQRLADGDWEITPQPQSPDGTRNYILKNLRHERYLLLSAKEHFLWQYFDGNHSLEEIARAFHFEFGAFDYAAIRRLLAKLYQAGVLVEPTELALRRSRELHRDPSWGKRIASLARNWRRLSIKVVNADRLCSALYRYGGWLLFNRIALGISIVLALVGAAAALRLSGQAKQFTQAIGAQPWRSAAVTLSTLLAASMLHMLVHALACKAYHRRVRELGFFLLQGVLPTFYADVTDIFMSTRRARVVVDFAGPMVEVVLGSAAFLLAYQSAPGVVQAILFGLGVLLWEGALLNLYPFNFLEMDGYNIVADLLAMPTLRQQSLALAPTLPRRLLKPRNLQRVEWIQIGYLFLCTASVSVYVITHFDALSVLLRR